MANASVFREVIRQYDRLQDESKAILSARREELYSKAPRLREIDENLQMTAARVTRAVLESARISGSYRHNGSSSNSAVNRNGATAESCVLDNTDDGIKNIGINHLILEIKETALRLNKEKRDIINSLGYSDCYLTDIFKCGLCKDTGYIGGMRCGCLKQRLIDKWYDLSGLKNALIEENFDTFDFRYYSDAVDQQRGLSPAANMRSIYSVCMGFIEQFDSEYSNLLFYGDTGLGKTFLCNCIAKELIDAGKTVLYVTAPRFFKKFEDYRFNRSEPDERDDQLEMVFDADLLIIDDLGSEFASIITNSELFNIVNTRLLDKRHVIISTNLSINEFQNTYSDRLASRFFGNFKMLKFFGDDIRVRKKLYHNNGKHS